MLMASNGRHAHEWRVFEDVRLPDGKYVIPGVLDSSDNVVEHPETVADRLIRYANVVGRERSDGGHRLRIRHRRRHGRRGPDRHLGEVPRPGRGRQDRIGTTVALVGMVHRSSGMERLRMIGVTA
jgi:hypothetical protein